MKMALTSSAKIPFTGKIQYIPNGYNNQTIPPTENDVRTLPFLSSHINWDNPTEIPIQLEVPLEELIRNQGTLYTVNTSLTIELAGSSDRCYFSQQPKVPVVILRFSDPSWYAVERFNPKYIRSDEPYFFLEGNLLKETFIKNYSTVPTKVDISFTIETKDKCPKNIWNNVFLKLTLNVEVILNCTGKNLDSPICANYCNKNMGVCFDDESQYCFPSNIGTSAPCQSYFANYIQKSGPDQRIDQGLSQYCKKYKGLSDLLSNGSARDIDLCACHLDPKQYQTFRDSIIAAYPNIGELPNIGLVQACLVPECADTNYTSTKTGKKCAIPQCLNIGAIGINGNVDKSNITIRQDVPECANIGGNKPKPTPPPPKPEPTPPPPKPEPTPQEKKTGLSLWMIIGIVALILIVLIVIILLIVGFRKRPSPPIPAQVAMPPMVSV